MTTLFGRPGAGVGVASHPRRGRACSAPAAGRGRHRGRPDDLWDQHRLRQACQRPHPPRHLEQLQANLIRSHAAGVGDPLPAAWSGRSCCSGPTCCSGPPAECGRAGRRPGRHAQCRRAAPGAGAGERGGERRPGSAEPYRPRADGRGAVIAAERRAPAAAALAAAGLAPFRFAPKEGLAFINGTQAQTALLALLVHDAEVLWRTAVGAAAMSLEALRGTPAPLDPRIHDARPHGGRSGRRAHARPPGGQRDPRIAPRERSPGAGRLQPALRTPGAGRGRGRVPIRGGDRGGRAERVDRQPAGVRERRGDLRRQLPRPAGGAGARLSRDRAHHPAGDRRAAGRAAGEPRPVAGPARLPHPRPRALAPA